MYLHVYKKGSNSIKQIKRRLEFTDLGRIFYVAGWLAHRQRSLALCATDTPHTAAILKWCKLTFVSKISSSVNQTTSFQF